MLQQNTVNVYLPQNFTYSRTGTPQQQQREATVNNCLWQEVINGIPANAITGGRAPATGESPGEPYYIGRIHHEYRGKTFLIPGRILASHRRIYYPYRGENSSNTFDVLVNRDGRQNFRWEPCSGGINNIPPNAVVGGHQDLKPMFIGRHSHEGAMVVGKVEPAQKCLYITYAGREIAYRDYEILVLAESRQSSEVLPTASSRQADQRSSSNHGGEFSEGVNFNNNNHSNYSNDVGFRAEYVYGHGSSVPPPPPPYTAHHDQPDWCGTKSTVGGTAANLEMPKPNDYVRIPLSVLKLPVAGASIVSSFSSMFGGRK